jgi:heme a synthase
MNVQLLKYITTLAILLALFVVTLGAYTRLTDAGLGCPDWPGCYGHMVLPKGQDALASAQGVFPETKLETHKAWTEMAHRYVAGSLGLLILVIWGMSFILFRRARAIPIGIPSFLIGLVVFQAMLGMWTVTLKLLPIVVMGHLLGGMLIFASLCYYRWQISIKQPISLSGLRPWILLTTVVVFIQIALGGWVSSNYAGIACYGFPTCNGIWWPTLYLKEAFNLLPIGDNYQGGLLNIDARITIQFVHRLGAIVTALMVFGVAGALYKKAKATIVKSVALVAIASVILQIILGIINVVYILPLWAAVAHNGVAAILFATMLSLVYLTKGDKVYVS